MYKGKEIYIDEEPLYIDVANKGEVKTMLNSYLNKDSNIFTPEKSEAAFVPFVHERDKLGRLISAEKTHK